MTSVVTFLPYIFPVLTVCIAVVFLCLYMQAKKKRAAFDVTTARDDNGTPPIQTISVCDDETRVGRHYGRAPPRYSTVDHPPPYSLFDPILTSVWPGGPPPAYEMYPITLPLAPHHWLPPTGSYCSSPSPSTFNHPPPPR